mgnify:FL=1
MLIYSRIFNKVNKGRHEKCLLFGVCPNLTAYRLYLKVVAGYRKKKEIQSFNLSCLNWKIVIALLVN